MTMKPTLRVGALAYKDSLAGLLPCRVLELTRDEAGAIRAIVKLTADRPGYRRGDVLHTPARNVIPRGAVYTRGFQFRIRAFDIEVQS